MKPLAQAAVVLSFFFITTAGIATGGPDLGKALAGADWSKMETVAVTMREYAFSPSDVILKEGVPTEKGTFDLLCTIKGHADHGMKGTIHVR